MVFTKFSHFAKIFLHFQKIFAFCENICKNHEKCYSKIFFTEIFDPNKTIYKLTIASLISASFLAIASFK